MTAAAMTAGSRLTSNDWCTPAWLCELLGRFDLDPCSNARSHVQSDIRRIWPVNGLAYPWHGSVFVNPPYSNVGPWAAKLADHTGPWCALLKLDPSTRWWATLMSANPIVAPFRKRIRFEGDLPMTANFPSVLVYRQWSPSDELAKHLWIARYA